MEIDQLVKRLDWFEAERRKEKGEIGKEDIYVEVQCDLSHA